MPSFLHMPGFLRCSSAFAAVLGLVTFARIASAAPVHAVAAPLRPIVIHASRPAGKPLFRGVVAPLLILTTRHAFTPMHALPLVVPQQHQRITGLAAFLPRIGWAIVAAPGFGTCRNARGPVRIAVLPATPVFSDGCARQSLDEIGELPPTSLVAGHNKNALYGRAYSATHDDER